jgi:hypothetical protein
VHFKDDEWDVETAVTGEEAKQLTASGFTKFDEFQSITSSENPKESTNTEGYTLNTVGYGLIPFPQHDEELKPNQTN